jgi:hypothetical protein
MAMVTAYDSYQVAAIFNRIVFIWALYPLVVRLRFGA